MLDVCFVFVSVDVSIFIKMENVITFIEIIEYCSFFKYIYILIYILVYSVQYSQD